MRTNFQTKFGNKGNCLAAAVSSIIDVDINEVPNVETLFEVSSRDFLVEAAPDLWGVVLYEWLRAKGYVWRPATPEEISNPPKDKPFLCIGTTAVNNYNHAVVYMNGKLFHDPHPSGRGLNSILSVQVIEKYDE